MYPGADGKRRAVERMLVGGLRHRALSLRAVTAFIGPTSDVPAAQHLRFESFTRCQSTLLGQIIRWGGAGDKRLLLAPASGTALQNLKPSPVSMSELRYIGHDLTRQSAGQQVRQ